VSGFIARKGGIMRTVPAVVALVSALAMMGPTANAQDSAGGQAREEASSVLAELNKVETVEAGCRSFFLFRNGTDTTLTGFEMSLAVLDRDGIIDRLLTIDAAPLPARRTTLKLFDIPDMACEDVGELILHDIATCADDTGRTIDCFDLLRLSSRAGIPFVP
jgi:hypothetical protein